MIIEFIEMIPTGACSTKEGKLLYIYPGIDPGGGNTDAVKSPMFQRYP
jgi:hypothetical protein